VRVLLSVWSPTDAPANGDYLTGFLLIPFVGTAALLWRGARWLFAKLIRSDR
jgi:hypothetical protein